MVSSRVVVALVAAGGLAVGCGGHGGQGDATTSRRPATLTAVDHLVSLPAATVRRCVALAPRRDIPVLCPTRLPKARWYVAHQTLRGGRNQYLTDLETKPGGAGDPSHVLAGGRRGRFSLETTNAKWPVDTRLPRDLGLVGAKPLKPGQRHDEQRRVRLKLVGRSSLGKHPALLLKVTDYPDGGVHSGHLAIIWNEGNHGYTLSLHFAEPSKHDGDDQEALIVQIAAAMSRFTVDDAG